ncbi:MAG: hypothetical protein V1745_02115 [Patescibacteria group bacterium]
MFVNTLFAILLASTGNLFAETSLTIGKKAVAARAESIYGMGFLNSLWTCGMFLTLHLVRHGFGIELATPYTFAVNCVLSLFQAWSTVHAISLASRSTYAFIRVGTIPMLLLIDVVLGYSLGWYQILGITLLCVTLLLLSMNHGLERRGIWYVTFGAVNAAIVTAIYKYDITHGNPIETEQFLNAVLLLAFFYVMSRRLRRREHPFALLKKPQCLLQSATLGIASIIGSYAYMFAPASIVMSADRSASVAWAVLSGRVAFKEKHLAIKIAAVIGFVVGLVMLAI